MEVERLREVLAGLSDTLVSLQRQIEEANQLLETVPTAAIAPISPQSRSGSGHERHSPSGSSSAVPRLERRVEELETDNRELEGNLEKLLVRHGMYEAEINHAVRAREGMMKKYRLLVRVAADLLQRVMEEFPDEEFDDETRGAVEADLRRRVPSPSTGTSSSSGTVRPREKDTPRHSVTPIHWPKGHDPQVGPSGLVPVMSDADSQLSGLTEGLAGPDGTLLDWVIHMGSKCPASVKVTAGPFVHEDFVRLHIDKTELDDLFHDLIYATDVTFRVAQTESPPRGLPDVKVVFLYDPFYLESGTRTYILDWTTARGNKRVINWLKTSYCGDENPVFHTFTYSKKKGHWYYFGAIRWTLAQNQIWPTLESETRTTILQHLSERSHGAVAPEEIEQQLETGRLQELSIEIVPVNERVIMEEIAARLGKSLREVKLKKPLRPDQ